MKDRITAKEAKEITETEGRKFDETNLEIELGNIYPMIKSAASKGLKQIEVKQLGSLTKQSLLDDGYKVNYLSERIFIVWG